MGSRLEDFLGLSDVSEVTKDIAVSVGGKALELKVRPLTVSEHSQFQRLCTSMSGKNVSFDSGRYNKMVLRECIVEPNFKDADFLKSAGCKSAEEFLERKFPAGVFSDVASRIQELSGFDSIEAEIENAKN